MDWVEKKWGMGQAGMNLSMQRPGSPGLDSSFPSPVTLRRSGDRGLASRRILVYVQSTKIGTCGRTSWEAGNADVV